LSGTVWGRVEVSRERGGEKIQCGVEIGTIFEMRGGDGDKLLSPCHPLLQVSVFESLA